MARWPRWIAALLTLALASRAFAGEPERAHQDRQQFPATYWPFLYYVSTASIEPDDREAVAAGMKFALANVSPQPIIERCTPKQVTDTLYRIDLNDFSFKAETWRKLVGAYPYDNPNPPLVVRADWLTLQISDQFANPIYFELALNGQNPKTRDEILKLVGVNNEAANLYGLVEGKSGVSKQRHRWIENHPIARGYAWGTRDVLKLDSDHDPLEHPDGQFKHDAEEWLIYRRKFSIETGAQGVLLFSFLANGKGDIVARAPVDIVEDHAEFRGLREIRNPGSCYGCHVRGPNLPTQNELRATLQSGVQLKALTDANKQAVEAFHFADVAREINREQEDYELAVKAATGCDGPLATEYFQRSIERYLEDVTLERAAQEYGTTPDNLKRAIALASGAGAVLPARVVGLAHQGKIPRDSWEQNFLAVKTELLRWATKK